MVQLKQITRNATFAWSPAKGTPLIASGTIAGAVDASFSQDSELEIWDLDLNNTDASAFELKPIAHVSTERKFYSLAWGYVTSEKPSGVIAGAMDDGHLNIWDVNAILENTGTSLITSNQTHRGAIKVVDFNSITPKLLMSAGAGGEFNIWDLENPTQPYPAPNRGTRVEDIEAAAWNRKVPHILATASSNGFTSIWDLKASREVLHLKTPDRKRVSTLAWDPDNALKIITGSDDDLAPLLHVWDLRNTKAPSHSMEGHSGGILSVDWCHLDSDLLLSCGKDNRTILWNPRTSKLLGEFPIASTWAFETRWCPQNPDIMANATFEGKITVHRLQSTTSKPEVNGNVGTQAAGEDFFNQRQYVSEGGFELKQVPKWLVPPCSVSFGFGGALVTVTNAKPKGEVKIDKYISEPKISENASEFEEAIRSADWTTFCAKQAEKATNDSERGDWELLKLLFESDSRQKLIEYLGVKPPAELEDLPAKLDGEAKVKVEQVDSEATTVAEPTTLSDSELKPKNNRLSGVFGAHPDDFLSQLSGTSSTKISYTNGAFSIESSNDSESDKLITQALLFGKFSQAVDICLQEDRLSDAFALAKLGDETVQKKVLDAYFLTNLHRSNYLRLLHSIVDSNLWEVADQADLDGWKQILVVFCTFAKTDDDFSGLCENLGKRLEREGKVEDAKVCYLAGRKLDKVVSIWIDKAENQEKEELKEDALESAFSVHARVLQSFIEKVTVFKQVKGTSGGDLKPLYDKYTEFIEIVASQGNLTVAQKYVDLLPSDNETVKTVKSRLSVATATAPAATAAKTPARTADPVRRGIPPASAPSNLQPNPYASSPNPYPSPATHFGPSPYIPYVPFTPSAPIAPPGPPPALAHAPPKTTSPYAQPPTASTGYTSTYTPPQSTQYTPGLQPTNPISSRVENLPPPPPKRTNENWNDPPMLPNPSRTRTPAPPVKRESPSPFVGATPAPPGPPPASAKPPQRIRSPPISSPTLTNAPFSPLGHGLNSQTPPVAMQPTPPIGPPPVIQPPPPRPATNFFPPPPRTQLPPSGPGLQAQIAPPQTRSPYAPLPSQQQNNFAPTPPPPTSGPPPPGPATQQYGPPPGRSQYAPQPASSPTPDVPTPPSRSTPAPPKYPSGDRSHIPSTSKPIYDILSNEIGRIKQVAQSPQQKRIVLDVDKRLNILFDLLNNDEVIPSNVTSELVKLSQALSQRQFDVAQQIQLEVHTANEQFSTWMVGIKRLIDMARALA